jgi:endogenous inhibitor of DNA gyrase (YacG/DUF329 family)
MAFISFSCPSCGSVIEASDDMGGQLADCPECKKVVQVPDQGITQRFKPLSKPVAALPSDQREVTLVDIRIPFNSICVICFKIIMALVLISAAFGGICGIIIGILWAIGK